MGMSAVLGEPLTLGEEQIHRRSGKALLVLPLLIGFALGVFFSPMLSHSEVEEPAITTMASPMSISCLRVPAMSVNAMQGVLRKNGVPSSPMEKFALTSFAATRDASMKSQAREEFSKLDIETQAKLKALSKDLVVRATRSSFSPFPDQNITFFSVSLSFLIW